MRFRFSGYELDEARFELSRSGRRLILQPKPLQLLLHLVGRHPDTVTKEELLEALWPEETVTEFSLTRAVRAVRRALGEDASEEGLIQTVRGRGYRVGVPVETVAADAGASEERAQAQPGERFVGREGALAQFETALQDTLEGRGGIVLVVGEPGIGKSRTAEEFAVRARRAGAEVHWARAHDGDDEPAYWPWMQIVRACVEIRGADTLREQMGAGIGYLAGLVPEVREKLPDAPTPPEQAPEQARFRLFDAVATFFQRTSKERPLVLFVEDLHWADEPSLRLLAFLARELGNNAHVLVVGTYRNVGAARFEPLEEVAGELGGQAHTTSIVLEGLSSEELSGFLEDDARVRSGSDLIEAIRAKTDGNPFFVREIVRLLEASGNVAAWDVEALDRLAVPAGVRNVVGQRVGRLSKEARRLLDAAAVIGEEATLPVLAQVAELEEDGLFEPLEEVEDAGFLREQGEPAGTFRFAHALVRETLYEALSRRHRVELHRKVGEVLEGLQAAQLESQMAALAHHFGRAAAGGDVEKAIDYASRAAQQSMARLGFEQAASHALRGIELTAAIQDPRRRAELEVGLRSMLGVALITTRGYSAIEVEENFARARELCEEIGDSPQLFTILFGLWLFYFVRGDPKRPRELTEPLVRLAPPSFAIDAWNVGGIMAFALGEYARAAELLGRSSEAYDPELHAPNAILLGQDPGVSCLTFAALVSWLRGYPDQAMRLVERNLSVAGGRAHAFSTAFARVIGAVTPWLCRDGEAAYALADAGIRLSKERGFALWHAAGLMARGAAQAELGRFEEAISDLVEGQALSTSIGIGMFMPTSMCGLASAYASTGRIEEAMVTVERGLELCRTAIDRSFEPELFRVKGELLAHAEAQRAQAEECFRRSLELAREQGALSFELRTAKSLARLWQSQGRTAEARALLGPLYERFTEGFETPDLREAQALLEALGGGEAEREGLEELYATAIPTGAERRHLTLIFCDLVDSTEMSQKLDPEELRDLVRGYQEICVRVIERYEGHIAQYLGDGVLVYFGYPRAHEDDAARAVRAALEIAEEFRSRPPPGAGRPRLAVRIGVHAGVAVVGEMGSGQRRETLALGGAANLAARLQGIAEPNAVVMSAAVRRLTQGYFFSEDLGTHALKGFAEPVAAYRVLRPTGVRSRLEALSASGLTPLVGREHELGLMVHRWEQVQEGRGQVVTLSGEAGIGKSRLIGAFRERLKDSAHTWLECRCTSYARDSALAPVIELTETLLMFQPDDSAEERFERLEAALGRWEMQESASPLASLLSLPIPERHAALTGTPESQRRRVLDATVRWLFTVARLQPLVLFGEDLHWADPSTLELLGSMMEQVPMAPVLVLLTHRPDFEAPWSARAYSTSVPLSRLTRRQAAEVVERIAGTPPLPEAVVREIVTRTDGIPLFVEELTKSVLESGVLEKGDAGYQVSGAVAELAIPETLHDSLTARLDRLSPVKEVAQLCATLGREFRYELLQAVSPLGEGELRQGLARLVEAELLYQQGQLPDATYVFKHALVQDTAYQSLLKSRRQQFHQQIAEALAERFPETAETQPELVAYHYTQGGLPEPAIDYWRRAGQRAIQRWANVEASRYLTRGLETLATLRPSAERSQQELGLRTMLGVALIATRGYGAEAVEHNFARSREVCEQLGDSPHVFPALFGLWLYSLVRADPNASELALQCAALAKRSGQPSVMIEGHNALGITAWARGELIEAREQLARSFALYDANLHAGNAYIFGQDPGISGQVFAAIADCHLGYLEQAREKLQRALGLAAERSHPFSTALAQVIGATLYYELGEAEAAHELTSSALALSKEQGFTVWIGGAKMIRGVAFSRIGDLDTAIAEIQAGWSLSQEAGTRLFLPLIRCALAEACIRSDRFSEARTALDEGFELARGNLDRYRLAELHRVEGELVLRSTSEEALAEACFDRALEEAQERNARLFELRAAVAKARLWQRQDRRSQARDLLVPIFDWFTEGFDSEDVRQAKALLDELAS